MPLPHEKDVKDMVGGLLGKEVGLRPSEPVPTARTDDFTVAVYTTNELKTAEMIVLDLSLSAYLGAALALVPATTAQDNVDRGNLTEDVMENLAEVLNVGASMFNQPNKPHIKLYRVYTPGERLPPDLMGWLSRPGARLDVAIDVPGYGEGRMGIIDTLLV